MLLDTGADVTIVPEHILQALEAKKLDVAYESIRSLGMGPCPTRVDSNLCSMIAARLPVPIPANILSQLADALSDAYRSPDLAAALATTSDLHVAKIALGSTTYTAWVAILEEAERQGQTETLLKQARTDYPHLAPLAAAVSAYTAWAASGRPGGATPASSPVTTEGRTVIHTGGGAYVGGGVTIGPGGAFVGRDQVTTTTSTQGGSLAEFTALLAEIRRSVAQAGLDADTTAALDADLRLVENQANKPAPNKALLLSRLEGAARLLTAAAGAATAVDRLLPAVQQAIAWASQLFR